MRAFVFFLLLMPSLLVAQSQKTIYYQPVADFISIDSLLSIIHTDGSAQLSYDPEIVPKDSLFIKKGKWTVLHILKSISANTTIRYKKVGKNYILVNSESPLLTISGRVLDESTDEHLIGALVRVPGTTQGVITNSYGFYSLDLPPIVDSIEVSYLGYQSKCHKVPGSSRTMVIKLKEEASLLEEVMIRPSEEKSLTAPQFGHLRLDANQLNSIGSTLGEKDLLRQLQLHAGVNPIGESSTGFSVRGGKPGHNLILLDEAVIYSPTHFVGLFSIFNTDALNKIDFYKGGIPARYGGRLSSITNVMMKEGNKQRFSGNGNINALAASLSLEGPLKKNIGSFMVSGRRSYIGDYPTEQEEAQLSFFDVNLKINYDLGSKDKVYLSSYLGKDRFSLSEEVPLFDWGNSTFTARWNHTFNKKLFLNTSFIFSDYNFNLIAEDSSLELDWSARLGNRTLKGDFNYFYDNDTQVNFGLNITFHSISPSYLSLRDPNDPSQNSSGQSSKSNGLENALYGEVDKKINDRWHVLSGIRLSSFHNIGPGAELLFDENFTKIGTVARKRAEFYNTYINVEPRLSLSYRLSDASSLKGSYHRSAQYISQASNSLNSNPLDAWFLSSPNVRPQIADQVSLGYFKKLRNTTFDFSIETYYRKTSNEIDFKDNADLLLNEELEGELRIGKGHSYGVELAISGKVGKLMGNANVTWGRSFIDIPLVNQGLRYPSSYDRPISLSIGPTYAPMSRKRLSLNWILFSGLPFTSPTGRFFYGNTIVPSYSNRNGDRLPLYHRLDISYEIDGKNKKKRRYRGGWSFAIYNAYNRKNANLIGFRAVSGTLRSEAVKFTLLGWVPSIAYRFKF